MRKSFEGVNGIGPTYMVTLLYFLKKGTYSIYDQFADRAINAIDQEIKPGRNLEPIIHLPKSKKDRSYGKMIFVLQDYKIMIDNLFEDEYYTSRDVDRALWVYGHMFKEN